MSNYLANCYTLLCMNYQKLLADNIKELRLKNNLTQDAFSEKIGLSLNGLSNIERNRYQPAASTIDKICKVFNITPVELLLTKAESNEDTIKNITVLLAGCSPQKLKRIYEIISMMLKL